MIASFSYPGGKCTIRERILPYMPNEGSVYIEPFAGRGNMFFAAHEYCQYDSWILNDITTAPFLRALRDTDLSNLKDYDYEYLKLANDPIALILEPRVTTMGKGYSAGGNGRKCNDKYIRNCHAAQSALSGAQILQANWHEIDYPVNSFVYFDPPYYDTYSEYGQIDHEALLIHLYVADFDWIISSYLNDFYIEHLGNPVAVFEKSSDMCQFNSNVSNKKLECIWSNL